MTLDPERSPVILVVEDVEETRDATEHLLVASGYVVNTARNEAEAVLKAQSQLTDVILISVGLDATHSAAMGQRIRERARLAPEVPIVVFCVPSLPEGAEEAIGGNTYIPRPDNFDQLRGLLKRLVGTEPAA
jgi:CheY-like chemotaxis protein